MTIPDARHAGSRSGAAARATTTRGRRWNGDAHGARSDRGRRGLLCRHSLRNRGNKNERAKTK
jgi:hypothetical protein